MSPFSMLTVCVLSLLVGLFAAGPAAAQENLVSDGSFSGQGFPAGWSPEKDWMKARFDVQSEGGETFVRVAEAPAVMETTFALPEGAKAIVYSARGRVQDFTPGAKGWDIPIVTLQILDGSGEVLNRKNWPTTLKFRDQTAWTTLSETVPVPPGGERGRIVVSYKGEAGAFHLAQVQAFTAADAPAAAASSSPEIDAKLGTQDLLPQTNFTGQGVPAQWEAGEPWMAAAFDVNNRGFLKMDKLKGRDGYYIQTTGPIDPSEHAKVRMYVQMQGRPHRIDRVTDVKQRPRVELTFENPAGQTVGEPLIIPITGFITHNALQSVIGDVPRDASQMRARIVYHGNQGWLELRNLHVVPATGEEPAWMHRPAEVPAGALFPHPIKTSGINEMPPQSELDREPGAVVDESKVSQTINVKPGELHAAFDRAKQLLDQGQGVKLVLAAGNYRIDKPLELLNLSDAAKEAVLVIEGAAAGEVFISGSVTEGFEPGSWELVDAQKRIYRHAWSHDWGFLSEGYYQPSHVLSHRREMLFVNGRSLNQEIIEGTTFVDRRGRVYNSVGMLVEEKGDGQGGYTYTGFRGLDVLDPGEFAVAELGPGDRKYDNHPYPNTLLLRLPEDVSTLEGATIEVAMTQELFKAEQKSNLVLRNLVFQHAASWWNNYQATTAVSIDGDDNFATHDVLVENCEVSWNNGKGLGFGKLRNGEWRNVTIASNGNFGTGFHHLYNVVCRNVDVLDNNWRGRLSDSDIHSTGGMTWSGERMRFYNCRFNGNYGSGWRSDVWVIDVIAEDCQFNDNHTHGIFHEIGWGPVVHRRCEMTGNGNGVQLTANQDLLFEDCTVLNNRNLAFMFYSMPGRVSPKSILNRDMAFLDYNQDITIRNSTIATRGSDSHLMGQNFGQGSVDNYHKTLREEYTGENNRFYHPDQRDVFETTTGYSDRTWADLQWWIRNSGEQPSSTWAPPQR